MRGARRLRSASVSFDSWGRSCLYFARALMRHSWRAGRRQPPDSIDEKCQGLTPPGSPRPACEKCLTLGRVRYSIVGQPVSQRSGLGRRGFLTVSGLAVGGLTLTESASGAAGTGGRKQKPPHPSPLPRRQGRGDKAEIPDKLLSEERDFFLSVGWRVASRHGRYEAAGGSRSARAVLADRHQSAGPVRLRLDAGARGHRRQADCDSVDLPPLVRS